MNDPRIAIACGGSGGHIYPALAVARSLEQRGASLAFIGSSLRMEKDILPKTGYPFYGLPIRPLQLRQPVRSAWSLFVSTLQAIRLISRLRPQVVLGAGNYISVPTILAAYCLRIPVVLMETNQEVGKANHLLAPLASQVTLAYESTREAIPHGRVTVTGSPVRPEFGTLSRQEGAAIYGLDPLQKTLLVIGGSQGAQFINEKIVAILPRLMELPDWQVVHICGEQHVNEIRRLTQPYQGDPRYCLLGYADNMPAILACTDFAISRAGAATIAELMACQIPTLFIPGLFGGGHQKPNAQTVAERGAGLLVEQEELTNERLWHIVRDVIADTERLSQMQQNCSKLNQLDAADRIAQIILQINQKHRKEARAC